MKGINSRNMSFCFVNMGWHFQHVNIFSSLPTTHTSISPAAIPVLWGVSSTWTKFSQSSQNKACSGVCRTASFLWNSTDKEIKQPWVISSCTREWPAFPTSSALLLHPRTPESDEREIKWACLWWSAMTQAEIQQTEWQGLCRAVTDGTSDLRAHNSVWWGGSCNLFCLMWALHSPRAICKLPGSFVSHKVWAPCWISWL